MGNQIRHRHHDVCLIRKWNSGRVLITMKKLTDPEKTAKEQRRAAVLRWCLFVLVFLGVAGLAGCCVLLWHAANEPSNGVRVEDLERDIKQHLPKGSTREAVAKWFATH